MAQVFNIDRADLKGWGSEVARNDWIYAVNAWYVQTHGVPTHMIVQNINGLIDVTVDPALTEPDLSNFQTELETLTKVTGVPGSWVFEHI